MSRVLEKDVAASLTAGNPIDAYNDIAQLFTTIPTGRLLELEILGKSHPFPDGCSVLRDGCEAAVSKTGLVQAFIVARQVLTDHIDASDDELLVGTAVILLMDPEHLTAANTRKRVLQGKLASGDRDVATVLGREKQFLDSLLTSRLHRHTKSPTLWGHLQWLLRISYSQGLHPNVLGDITSVVMVAGERHPRNYYAWGHARFLVQTASKIPGEELLSAVKFFCFQHHTDTSGWSFLVFLLNYMPLSSSKTCGMVFDEVMDLVISLRLTNESVWVFLRTLAASSLIEEEKYLGFAKVGMKLLGTSSPTSQGVLRSALEWCNLHRITAQPPHSTVVQGVP